MTDSPSPLDEFLVELKRRKVYRVAAAYAAVGFLLWQAAEIAVPALGLPEWVLTFVVVGTLLGFPVAVLLAWFFEVRREESTGSRAGAAAARLLVDRSLRRRLIILVGASAVVVAVTGVAVTLMRPGGAQAAMLQQGDRIVLADFQSHTGDDELAATVRAAFQIDLAQSDYFAPVPAAAVNDALRRMERDPTNRLTPEVAREIALRDGYPATLQGQVDAAGSGWIFSVQLVAAITGEILLSEREAVTGDDDVLPAVDRLSARLRARIGESLENIEAAPPLPDATTHSLDALRAFARGLEAFQRTVDFETMELHLNEAIRLDSTFAMAYGLLSGVYGNSGRQRLAAEHATMAYDLRERLSTPDRLFVTSGYHYHVTGDLDAAETAIRTLVQDFPGFPPGALVILSAIQLRTHRLAAAESSLVRLQGITGSLNVPQAYNLVSVQLSLGKTNEALATVDALEAVTGIVGPRARAYFVLQRWDAADSVLVIADLPTQAWHRSLIALIHGRLADFDGLQRQWVEGAQDERGSAFGRRMWGGNAHLVVAGDSARARTWLARAAEDFPDVLSSNSADRGRLADLLAAVGDTGRARSVLASFETGGPPVEGQRGAETARARILFAQGKTAEALRTLRFTVTASEHGFECGNCDVIALAELLDTTGQADSAIVQYEAVAAERAIFGPFREVMALYLPRARERLAQLYEQRGDTAKAVEHHRAFVDLWQDADPELQPRVAAAREAIERLGR